MNIQDLKTKGSVSLEYPADLRQAVVRAVRSWKNFCSLPTATKKGLPYSNNADGVGYELKEGVGRNADRKENFDLTTASKAWLERNASVINDSAALAFVQDATALVAVMKPTIMKFARECEQAFGLAGFAKEVEASEGGFFVRFIHYFGDRKVGDETASAHADQSCFTLHLFESHPGLQCLTYDKQWVDMPVSEGETVIIPAMQMQLRSDGQLRALAHRVVAVPETADTGRYSAVCFIQLKGFPKYDKDTHGRLQEKVPGFNYDMPIGAFKDLFKA
jgi:isopenicillin N synthase-like dioxygenase